MMTRCPAPLQLVGYGERKGKSRKKQNKRYLLDCSLTLKPNTMICVDVHDVMIDHLTTQGIRLQPLAFDHFPG